MKLAAIAITLLMSGAVVVQTSASAQAVQPSNTNPARDTRGIKVISDPATTPGGWNGASGTAMGGAMVNQPNGETVPMTGSAPVCSAKVTDHCRESYRQDFSGR